MKKLIGIGFMLLMVVSAWAQDDDLPQPHDPKVKDKINSARIAYITDQLGLTPAEAEKFWPIYREFSQNRVQIKQQYKEMKKNPDPNKTPEQNDQALVDLQFQVKQKELDLEKDYSGRLLKVISAQKLRTLPDAEKRFRQMILEQIQRRQTQQNKQQHLRDKSQQQLQKRNN
jgi:hypothetical protein